jgi:murein DD-endopeptidase MepM/ murein hydrolase activator NlpD
MGRRRPAVPACYDPGGYGNLVVIAHRAGMTSFYAHLASIALRRGRCVPVGARVGTVGSTGNSTGPHLHFELRLRGAAVDPLSGLQLMRAWPPRPHRPW